MRMPAVLISGTTFRFNRLADAEHHGPFGINKMIGRMAVRDQPFGRRK
jgi:hypothetical protein